MFRRSSILAAQIERCDGHVQALHVARVLLVLLLSSPLPLVACSVSHTVILTPSMAWCMSLYAQFIIAYPSYEDIGERAFGATGRRVVTVALFGELFCALVLFILVLVSFWWEMWQTRTHAGRGVHETSMDARTWGRWHLGVERVDMYPSNCRGRI